jgi:hypothetical protein
MKQDDVMYGFDDSERLFNELDEFIEMFLDDCDKDFIINPASTLTIYTYRRMTVTAPSYPDVTDAAERIYESLDEKYDDPDGDGCEVIITDKAKEHYAAFVAEIVGAYVPWAGEIDRTVPPIVVNVREWVEKNAPEWLKEGK